MHEFRLRLERLSSQKNGRRAINVAVNYALPVLEKGRAVLILFGTRRAGHARHLNRHVRSRKIMREHAAQQGEREAEGGKAK